MPSFRTRSLVHYGLAQRGHSAIFTANGLQIHRDKHPAIVRLDRQHKPFGPPSIRMPKIDQFESIFRAASKEAFEPAAVKFERVMVVTDLDEAASQPFCDEVKTFLGEFTDQAAPTWKLIDGKQFSSVPQLLDQINDFRPDLICTYRNLHIPANEHPYSLGVYVDVLTQATSTPILLMPRMELQSEYETAELARTGTAKVMAITDHLAGDHHLVNVAASLVRTEGKLFLTHVEDQVIFERFLDVIDKIAEIDSNIAREAIVNRLLAEPRDYIESCRQVLEQQAQVKVESIVTCGHLLKDHQKLIEEHEIDLLVLHTKDDDQLAMHGLAYPLAVEMRKRPMLLI